jgi:hypothetical protein
MALTTKSAPSSAARRSVRLFHDHAGAGFVVQQLGQPGRFRQRRRITADQNERRTAQLAAAKNIAQHAQAERHTGRAEEGDFGMIAHRACLAGKLARSRRQALI